MPGTLRSGDAGEQELRLARQVISGLHSLHDSLTQIEGSALISRELMAAAQTDVQMAIQRVKSLLDVARQRATPLSVKYVSDQLQLAIKQLNTADSFSTAAQIVPYSVFSVGRDIPELNLQIGRSRLNDATAALRLFISAQLESSPSFGPEPVENVPSPLDYVWDNTHIVIAPSSANTAVFPFPSSERDHAQRLEACFTQAEDLASDLGRRRWQVREDYAIELSRYARRLPATPGTGNILLADAAARNLREIFAAEQSFLPAPFAARLKTMLQQHIALRPFYPEVSAFYDAVKFGHISEPLPMDAVEHFVDAVQAQTPQIFDPSVIGAMDETAVASREIVRQPEPVADGPDIIAPPADPLGEIDPKRANDFQVAGIVNRLWKVFIAGEGVNKAAAGWIAAYAALSPSVTKILAWLYKAVTRQP